MSKPETSSSMSLGPLTIIWGLLCGLAAGGLMSVGEPMNMRLGMIVGASFAVFAMSLFCGWIAWAANGRRPGGGRGTFAVIALLLASGQAVVHKYQTSAIGVLTAMQPALNAEGAAMAKEAQNPALRADQVEAIVERLGHDLEAATRQLARGPGKDLVLALRNVRKVIATNELGYAAAVYAFIDADALELSALKSVDQVRERERLCSDFAQQNVDYLAYLDATPLAFEQAIKDIKMDESTRRDVAKGFTNTLIAARARVAPMVDARAGFARHVARLYRHLEATDGRWDVGQDGKLMFQLDADLAAFNTLANEIDALQAKLAEIESGVMSKATPEPKAATKVHGAR